MGNTLYLIKSTFSDKSVGQVRFSDRETRDKTLDEIYSKINEADKEFIQIGTLICRKENTISIWAEDVELKD